MTATYPGASAQVLTDSVTSVIEEELNGAKNLLYFESTSNANGIAEITVTFQPGTDPELAQSTCRNRLKKAEARAAGRADLGIQTEQATAGFLLIYSLRYKDGDKNANTTALADYAVRNVNNEIRRLPGVGKLQFFDSKPPCACGSTRRNWSVTACPSTTSTTPSAPRTCRCRPAPSAARRAPASRS
ncbi:efflux RND transporter permease subunit [Klebsiella pneumoniae]|uniref:efflux RND transporter permease subunit n=1 Tax=Klebsiella pneumoniae TaxID=573 RepID=UPI0039767F7E